MPWGLRRFHKSGQLHFITFSCYRRRPLLTPAVRSLFERALERARVQYGFYIVAYVVMPEHVHLLMSEPERGSLASAIQSMKQSVARRAGGRFWQERGYDFNVWSRRKLVEKRRYIHRNPVTRGLVRSPDEWPWSSFRQYARGEKGVVEIECQRTGREREKRGEFPKVKIKSPP